MESFRAFVATKQDDQVDAQLTTLDEGDLPDDPVLVRVEWSSVNYKDGLATIPKGQVARISPLVPGIDLAGEVVSSEAEGVEAGQRVVVHGYGMGVAHHGGFAEYARVPAGWVVPLPDGLSARQAMAVGTAGYTAALSVLLLEERGLRSGDGPVLVIDSSSPRGRTSVAMRRHMSRRRSIGVFTESAPSRATPRRMKGSTVVLSAMPPVFPLAATAPPWRSVRRM